MGFRSTILLAAGLPEPRPVARRRGSTRRRSRAVTATAESEAAGRDAARIADDALLGFVRAACVRRVRLALEFDPFYSALVAQAAGQYVEPIEAEGTTREIALEPPVVVYATAASEESLQTDARMASHGYARLERFPAKGTKSRPNREANLAAMRKALIERENPVALVVIGGGASALSMTEIYRQVRPQGAIYVFEKTGGAAARLAASERGHAFDAEFLRNDARSEQPWMTDVPVEGIEQEPRGDSPGPSDEAPRKETLDVPYGFLVHELIAKITGERGEPRDPEAAAL